MITLTSTFPPPFKVETPVLVNRSEVGSLGMPLHLRVAIVDDNRDAATTLGMILGLCGADVRVYHDAASLLHEALEFQPQAALLDINMPQMDGCELARQLRPAVTAKPMLLIAITGVSDSAARQRTREAGFNLHFTKPAEPAELISALANFDWWIQTQPESSNGRSTMTTAVGERGRGF